MSAEVVRVLATERPSADGYYATTLFAAADAHAAACTAKSTVYTASIAAGLMLGQFTKWLRGLPVDRTGSPYGNDALYVTDGVGVYGITVGATGFIRLWRNNYTSIASLTIQ